MKRNFLLRKKFLNQFVEVFLASSCWRENDLENILIFSKLIFQLFSNCSNNSSNFILTSTWHWPRCWPFVALSLTEVIQVFTPSNDWKQVQSCESKSCYPRSLPSLEAANICFPITIFNFCSAQKTFELCRYRRRKKPQLLHIFAIFMHPQQSYAKCLFLSHSSLLKLFKLATHRFDLAWLVCQVFAQQERWIQCVVLQSAAIIGHHVYERPMETKNPKLIR